MPRKRGAPFYDNPDAFLSRLKDNADTSNPAACWIWTGRTDRDGYARFGSGGLAHRMAYIAFKEPIPEGHEIDHLCRTRACVNPDHLEAVTKAVNTLRSLAPSAINAREVRCIHGHPFTEANTLYGKNGRRTCRTCLRASNAAGYRRRRAEALGVGEVRG